MEETELDDWNLQVCEGSLSLRRDEITRQMDWYEKIIPQLIAEVRRQRREIEQKDREIERLNHTRGYTEQQIADSLRDFVERNGGY